MEDEIPLLWGFVRNASECTVHESCQLIVDLPSEAPLVTRIPVFRKIRATMADTQSEEMEGYR